MKLAAQNAQAEVKHLQQQLGSLKSKAADTARQLSAARTAAHEAQQELAAEQQCMQQQAAVMDELRTELEKARRCGEATDSAHEFAWPWVWVVSGSYSMVCSCSCSCKTRCWYLCYGCSMAEDIYSSPLLQDVVS